MIDRKCPRCQDKAAVTDFINEIGQLAKLWKCRYCATIWGVPMWGHFGGDNPHHFQLEPWMGNESTRGSRWLPLLFGRSIGTRPAILAMVVITIAGALVPRHWL